MYTWKHILYLKALAKNDLNFEDWSTSVVALGINIMFSVLLVHVFFVTCSYLCQQTASLAPGHFIFGVQTDKKYDLELSKHLKYVSTSLMCFCYAFVLCRISEMSQ